MSQIQMKSKGQLYSTTATANRRTAEQILRDAAFVIQMTRRVKSAILRENGHSKTIRN